jgi:hypothetical protein
MISLPCRGLLVLHRHNRITTVTVVLPVVRAMSTSSTFNDMMGCTGTFLFLYIPVWRAAVGRLYFSWDFVKVINFIPLAIAL